MHVASLLPQRKKLNRLMNPPSPRYLRQVAPAPARRHSVMVVRCWWGDITLKPWEPKP